jgi:hypothetical protein
MSSRGCRSKVNTVANGEVDKSSRNHAGDHRPIEAVRRRGVGAGADLAALSLVLADEAQLTFANDAGDETARLRHPRV